ncbi:MAG: hypothetical protein Q9163_006520, partial [Psora crenata]
MEIQSMQPSFFYYNPEPTAEHRQHGHFSQHPGPLHDGTQAQQQYMQQFYYPGMIMHGQQPMMYPQIPVPSPQLQQKPVVPSPRPLQQKSAFVSGSKGLSLDTACGPPDLCIYPPTPPLSVSGSATSSPPSSGGIRCTPTAGSEMNLANIEGVKEGCEG